MEGLEDITLLNEDEAGEMGRYVSVPGAWALSLGCAVGWGAFVMPGTTFLPHAGPVGTVAGVVAGALIMLIIGMNYHYLMNKFPTDGGTLTYSSRTFGYDHGFLSAWFLLLAYVAIIWANATALSLIARNLLGNVLQFGFHYVVIGYDVYLGEVLLALAMVLVFGFVCMKEKRLAVGIEILLAVLLVAGIVIVFVKAVQTGAVSGTSVTPAFVPGNKTVFKQIISIVVLSPWAFVGFESVSNSTGSLTFSGRKIFAVFVAALIPAALCYALLALLATGASPVGYKGWLDHVTHLSDIPGLGGLPTFYTAGQVMGNKGLVILAVSAASGIITGLIGNFLAAGHLLYYMAKKEMLPRWFSYLDAGGNPSHAVGFLMAISLVIPFFGRTAIGWIVDVNTIGATVAYGYTSAAAIVNARREGKKLYCVSGFLGLAAALVFFLYFMTFSTGAMAPEAYVILAVWSIMGFTYFRHIYANDTQRRFGMSTVVWIGLLFLILFTSIMWNGSSGENMLRKVTSEVESYFESKNEDLDPDVVSDIRLYTNERLEAAEQIEKRNSVIQILLIIISLWIMYSIYTIMSKREKDMEIEKVKAEDNSRAKTIFLSNMSHDIRTPMNAIIGYLNIAEQENPDLPTLKGYMAKIKSSSVHLLALINDVLEMSRIESGKMDLEPIAVDLKKVMQEVHDMFKNQMDEKHITFKLDMSGVKDGRVYCDKNRLNRVLLNLISNAWKFTPDHGMVTLELKQLESGREGFGRYLLSVSDTGIGMSKEFAARVFDAFEREDEETINEIQGTGLGMAITKSIVDLMGGTIEVHTVKGKGTSFIICLTFELIPGDPEAGDEGTDKAVNHAKTDFSFAGRRLLLVDDIEINRQIAALLLKSLGFTVECAENGQEAVEKVKTSKPGYFDAVLMDIQMPVMDGYSATTHIRTLDNEALASIPIVAMTANAFSEDVRKAYDMGMNGHVPKPIDLNVLTRVLREVLE